MSVYVLDADVKSIIYKRKKRMMNLMALCNQNYFHIEVQYETQFYRNMK